MAVLLKLQQLGVSDRRLVLYDTFSGMTAPSSIDVDAESGATAQDLLDKAAPLPGNNIWCIASVDEVRENLRCTGYPMSQVTLVEGDVEETLRNNRPRCIALLRLDTDWYQSTYAELNCLYPIVAEGGVCIVDDYGHWDGARRAVDQYLTEQKIVPLFHVIDTTGRCFMKRSKTTTE